MAGEPFVFATAGHVDHGKTSLVRALTGIDTDRLPEEKARGISIALGFAHATSAGGRVLSFVDVPGHERFVRTMVAGASGVHAVLLVVAADEGVMPQTREHLAICALLGLTRGLVALTKIDLVDGALQALARDELRAALEGTPLASAPVLACSARDGRGLPELRAALDQVAAGPRADGAGQPARLPVDRVFLARGFGLVATGTVAGSGFSAGAAVRAWPSGVRTRIRRIEVRGRAAERAAGGERAALNLPGLGRGELARGDVVALDGQLLPSAAVEARLLWLPNAPAPLPQSARLRLLALTAQEEAFVRLIGASRLAPGETGFAHVRLGRPLALLPGDRFVLRGFDPSGGWTSAGRTWGGGQVLRVLVSSRRRRPPGTLDRLRALDAGAGLVARARLEIDAAGARGQSASELAVRLALSPPALNAFLSAQPDLPAFGRARADAPPVEAGPGDGRLAAQLHGALEAAGLAPPALADLAATVGAPLSEASAAVATLVRQGLAVRAGDLVFARGALDELRGRLCAFLAQRGTISTQEWKALVGQSRKYAIPLAALFDSQKVTLRVGDVRRLRAPPPPPDRREDQQRPG
jgi:selenocysteine-specific elongation factor